ncbi:MAG: uroporphyrinogen decarboxylase family protein [Planctomycetota bacterium]|jgi:uroporphyrinogen decarboxylase|nr:uroporphyrinogen decarboxylase family protein [Planctomycetota bacterium]MDP6504493.1 uroporphyrinogen decarboxylase family protein [Planctomycetota bacterium]
MTELERFLTVVRFESPDYWPLINAWGLGYVHSGGLIKLHQEGLPEKVHDLETWLDYWGQCGFEDLGGIGRDAPGIKSERWVEEGFEFVRSETGAFTRQVLNNENAYSMPEFIEFDVRDRASWEKFRELSTPRAKSDIEDQAERLEGRTRPARVSAGSTWGRVRSWMGPERALLAVYDDPELVQEMIEWQTWMFEEFTLPVIERYRPETISMWEDFCYNHGMMISPAMFEEFCAPHYRRVAEVGRDCGAELLIVDSDGKVDEYCQILERLGLNGCWPMEQVCGNDLLAYREEQPDFIFAGGIEKEVCNTGNGHRIEGELIPRVAIMLEKGGYFPMFDHALQTDVGFSELCRCMTLLHEICGSEHLGEFPRSR